MDDIIFCLGDALIGKRLIYCGSMYVIEDLERFNGRLMLNLKSLDYSIEFRLPLDVFTM